MSVEQEATRLAEDGQFKEAAELLESCLSNQPQDQDPSRCYEMLAQCYLVMDRPTEAYHNALEATKRSPDWTEAHLTLGRSARNAQCTPTPLTAQGVSEGVY